MAGSIWDVLVESPDSGGSVTYQEVANYAALPDATQQSGIDVSPPIIAGTVSLDAASIGVAIINKISDLNALIDAADTL